MKNRSSYAVLTRFGTLGVLLATLAFIASTVFASSHLEFDYPENGEDPVATFSATDEDAEPGDVEWSLEGVDKDIFSIDGGVLAFKKSPSFESAKDADEDTAASGNQGKGDNVYKVTVVASGSKQAVEVTVTDLEEEGEVTFKQLKPQVSRTLEAEVNDPDGGVTKQRWQWYRGTDRENGPWTAIEGAKSRSRSPVVADIDNYLRVVVTYTDRRGADKSAEGVTEELVEARTVSNAVPRFGDIDPIEVNENATGSIGDPIVATDADNDLLQYFIDDDGADDADNAKFKMSASGQLSLAKALNYELTDEDEADDADAVSGGTPDPDADDGAEVYTVKIKVTDPSGAVGRTTLTVELADVNEEPEFNKASKGQATLYIDENTGDTAPGIFTHKSDREADDGVAPFAATDGDNVDDIDDAGTVTPASPLVDTITYMLEGGDAESFDITEDGGVLTSDTDLRANREKKGSYSIAVVAVSTRDTGDDAVVKYDRLEVTITVQDAEDTGMVTLSAREPQVSRAVLATLDDPDGSETAITWQWYRGGPAIATDSDGFPTTDGLATITTLTGLEDDPKETTNNVCGDEGNTDGVSPTQACVIDGATSALYTPSDDDIVLDDEGNVTTAYTIHAVATYKDGFGGDTESTGVSSERPVEHSDPGNTAPVFPDQDLNTAGDQSETAMRSVKENDKNAKIGEPISASDVDKDLLLYTISGADAGSFNIGRKDGQLTVDGTLDYEAQPEHTVIVTATDPSGAYDMITVTVKVLDQDDPPTITLGGAPPAPPAPDSECVTGGAVADANNGGLTSDCEILLAGMDELVGDGTVLNWSADTPMDEWDGVASGTGRVASIYLKSHGLAGQIPAGCNGLSALTKLQLHDNDPTGEIPDLSDLDNLIWLILQDNSLSGSLSATLGDMDSLDYLYLRGNGFSGEIPTELAGVMTLRRVDLRGNDLTGSVPAEFGDIERLRYLMLSDNDLSGSIPVGLGSSANMVLLYLSDNGLAGSIPPELGNVTTLRRLQLHNNALTGDVPAELGNLSELTNLSLSGNMLTGCVPAAVYDALADAADTGLMACPPPADES